MVYSGTKCVPTLLLFPSIVLHSTMTLFMSGPLQWKRDSSQSTKFHVSRVATYVNIIITSGSIFLVALLFEKSARDENGNTLLSSKESEYEYGKDAYRLWNDKSSSERYSIYDPSAIMKIVILVIPTFSISLLAVLILLKLPTYCCKKYTVYPVGVLDPNNLKTQLLRNGVEIEEEMYE